MIKKEVDLDPYIETPPISCCCCFRTPCAVKMIATWIGLYILVDIIFVFAFMGWSMSLAGIYCISLVLFICSLIPFLRFCNKDRLRTREGLTEAYLFFKFAQFIQSISLGVWICFFFHDFYLDYRADNDAHNNESL